MAITTGTVTVNAAFLQEIKEDNRDLRRLLAETDEAFSQPLDASVPARPIADALVELRDQLAMHFSLEEAFGYFENAVSVDPRLSETAESLRSQHVELFGTICELVEDAEKLLYGEDTSLSVSRLTERFLDFRQRFHEHEAGEDELILEALDDDIGVGD